MVHVERCIQMHIYMMFIQKISVVGSKYCFSDFYGFWEMLYNQFLLGLMQQEKVSEIIELFKRDLANLGKIPTSL